MASGLGRGMRVRVSMDTLAKRTRAPWYGGGVVARAEALDEHTVLFDDGEQLTLPLLALVRAGEAESDAVVRG
eukprot:2534851-Prymnesium_polylepis.1